MGLARRSRFRPCLEPLEDRRLLTGGALDLSFGGGPVVSGLTLPGVADSAHALVVQPDHKIVVVGAERPQPSLQTQVQNDDFALVRYNADGSLDTGFGAGGRVTTDFGGRDTAQAVARQADGKLVVVGSMASSAAPYASESAAIARYNADGSLDSTFGSGGLVTTDFGGGSSAAAVVLQADGKILVAGSAGESTTATMAVARYTPDGALDPTFGTGGVATTNIPFQVLNAPSAGPSRATAVTLQGDGKVVVAGNGQYGFGVVRFNADGTLDSAFGTGGRVALTNLDRATGVAVQADGRVVVAGDAYDSARGDALALYRFNAGGSADTGFGTAGRVQTQLGSSGAANGLALQADGTILVAGYAGGNFALLRYQADGSPDATFGQGGKVATDFGSFDAAAAVAVMDNGKIVVAGTTGGSGQDGGTFAVARYLSGGSLDTNFGAGGQVTTDFPRQTARTGSALAVQADGKVVVAGYAPLPSDPAAHAGVTLDHPVDIVLSRYNADGSPDLTFGSDGQAAARFLNFQDSPLTVEGMTLQPDGKIVVVGQSTDNGGDFAVERFNADGSLDGSFGNGGQVTTDFFGGADEAFGVAVQPNGKIVVVGGAFNASSGFSVALARYRPDGSLDPNFGNGGRLTTAAGLIALASSVRLQPDGKMLVAGVTAQGSLSTAHFTLFRYNPNGTIDGSFGSGGAVVTFAGMQSVANALRLQPDGKIVVAGVAGSGGSEAIALARYTTNGNLDPTFGNGGKVRTAFAGGPVSPVGLAVRPDGTIVVAGTLGDDGFGTTTTRGFALAQYKPNGNPDLGFGTGGQLTTDFGSAGTYDARGLAVDGSGNVLVAGTVGSGDSRQALVARFQDGARSVTTLTSYPIAVAYGTAVTFTATVSAGLAGLPAPSGAVQFQLDGVSVGSPVALAGGSASSTLPLLKVGAHVVTAIYSGDGTFNGSSGAVTEVVAQVPPQLSVSDPGGTYNGSPFPATASISGLDGTAHHGLEGVGLSVTYYAGKKVAGVPLSGAPSAPGKYTVVVSFGGSADYAPALRVTTFTIQKAVPAVTVSDAGGTYNGSPFSATASISGLGGTAHHGLEGVGLTLTYYAGSTAAGVPLSGAPSAAGTYTVVASFGGSADYAAAQSPSVTFTILKATPTVSVSDAGGTYNGSSFPASASVTGLDGTAHHGLEGVGLTLTYYVGKKAGGVPLGRPPSVAGTYTVVASFGGSADYAPAQATATFTILS